MTSRQPMWVLGSENRSRKGKGECKMRWDVYECDGEHKIIVENKRPGDVTDTIPCPICQNIAVYDGSVKDLSEVKQ